MSPSNEAEAAAVLWMCRQSPQLPVAPAVVLPSSNMF
jgi:hypothetical protein